MIIYKNIGRDNIRKKQELSVITTQKALCTCISGVERLSNYDTRYEITYAYYIISLRMLLHIVNNCIREKTS
jgi:hypothetical protein